MSLPTLILRTVSELLISMALQDLALGRLCHLASLFFHVPPSHPLLQSCKAIWLEGGKDRLMDTSVRVGLSPE